MNMYTCISMHVHVLCMYFITVSCLVRNKPPNGVLSTTATNPGVIVTLYCNDGFQFYV